MENKQGLKEQLAESILTDSHNEIIIKNNQKQSKIITNCQKSSKNETNLINLNNREYLYDRTGTYTQRNTALFTAGNNTDTNKPTITTQSSETDTAKPGGANSFSYGSKQGFAVNFDPIRRNLAALDQCVQQLKFLTSILANIPKKQIKNKEISR